LFANASAAAAATTFTLSYNPPGEGTVAIQGILNVQPWLAYTDNGSFHVVKQTCLDNPAVSGNQC
jgi:hypothetical protein